ncbi:MAG TPA: hypothetical protein VJ719_01815 [Chthoniobacterales bacterium]|nr:hypothetical protein [Chthoniobacterales bacterium]
MKTTLCSRLAWILAAVLTSSLIQAQEPPNVYAPFEFLIGEWDIRAADSDKVMAVQRVRWGPNRSYMWYSVALISDGKEEPHLEGMLMWNGVHKNLDMLFAIDLLSGRSQEQGTISATKDGELVREITAVHSEGVPTSAGKAIGSEGGTRQFRQIYKRLGPDKIETSVMRKTDQGWVASFPGSDKWIMTRRSG